MQKILTEKELADALQISPWTARTWRIQLGMPHFRTAGRIFYRLETVEKWLSELEEETQSSRQQVNDNQIRRITP